MATKESKTQQIRPPSDGAHLASHDVIYQGPMEHWQSGIPLGNGDTSVVAYQQAGSLLYGVTRAGLHDKRNPIHIHKTHEEIRSLRDAGRYDELDEWDREENAHYMRRPYPNPRPAGVLTLIPADGSDDFGGLNQVLCLRDGVLVQESKEITVQSFVSRDHDCLCLEIRCHGPLTLSFSPTVDYPGKGHHWWDEFGCIDSEITSEYETTSGGALGRFAFPGGEAYAVAIEADCAFAPAAGEPHRWNLDTTSNTNSIRVYLAVATNEDGNYYTELAIERARRAHRAGIEAVRTEHIRDWHAFWSVNCLLIEDKYLENLFYLGQYLLRCNLGGKRVYGSMNAWHLGTQPWHGDMHTNINVEMAWLPVFPLNRAELSDSFNSHFAADLDDARRETERFWGVSGLSYPFASVGTLKPLHGGYWRYEVYVSAWVAQVIWERYRFTGDVDYLRDVCYPIQKDVLNFYESCIATNEEGLIYFPMVKPVESQRGPDGSPFVENSLLDIAALRQLLNAAIQASETLDTEPDLRSKWMDMLARLSPLPADADRGVFLAFSGASPDLSNDHPTLLGPLFPSGLKLSEEETRLAVNSLSHMLGASKRGMEDFPFKNIFAWGDDLSYSWLTIAAARLGQREVALAYLYDFLVLLQLKKNGLFASRPSDVLSRDQKVSLINTTGGFMLALTEMFIQSFDDTIRVFPAVPESFTGAFAGLKTAGDFTVDAAQAEGKLLHIVIRSGSGGTARVRNDWGKVRIENQAGEVTLAEDGILTLQTQPGGVYVISPRAAPVSEFPLTFEAETRGSARTWTGPRYLDHVSPADEWNVSIGQ